MVAAGELFTTLPKACSSVSSSRLLAMLMAIVLAVVLLSSNAGEIVRSDRAAASQKKMPVQASEAVVQAEAREIDGEATAPKAAAEAPAAEVEPEVREAGVAAGTQTGAAPMKCAAGSRLVPVGDTKVCKMYRKIVENQRMYAVDENGARYVVCVPPKNGSTVHRGLIFRILGIDMYDAKWQVHNNDEVKDRMFLVNFTNEQIEEFFEGDMERYVMVRNPIKRTLSGYMNAVGRRLGDEVEDKPGYFQKWVRTFLREKNLRKTNEHYQKQTAFCGFEYGLGDRFKVFKVEEPEKYVEYLESIIPSEFVKDGWPRDTDRSFRDYVLGPKVRTHGTEEMFFEYVGDLEVFDIIAELYQEDIDVLGYREEVDQLRKELKAYMKSNK